MEGRYVTIPLAGHISPLEGAESFHALMREFLAGRPAGAGSP